MCPSEVSDIERTLWQRYQDQGLVVWGIGSQDGYEDLVGFRDQMGVTFPILFDEGARVQAQYEQVRARASVYPQDWIIGPDGVVLYVNNAYDAEAMSAIIESALP